MSSNGSVYKYPPTRTISVWVRPAKEAIRDAVVGAIIQHQLRRDAPCSPEITKDLLQSMPHLTGRLQVTFPWTRAKPVDKTQHTVWIFDNTAFRIQDPVHAGKHRHGGKAHASMKLFPNDPVPPPQWQVEYVVAYFSRQNFHDASHVVYAIARLIGLANGTESKESRVGLVRDALEKTPIKERLEYFLNPILAKRTIRVNIGDTEFQTLGPSTSSGISSDMHFLHFDVPPGNQIITIADSDWPATWSSPAQTVLAEPTGWGIISDIDDTIKVTGTLSPVRVLETTFIEEAQPIAGMPELYSHIRSCLGDPIFFYLSASPYNLYMFLRSFRKQYYPDGTLILREASWQNLGGLISSLTLSVRHYKLDRLKKLHSWFPHRQFICIGDSTQKDPESYGDMARCHPACIKYIFIRRVSDPEGILPTAVERNSTARFEKAFSGLDRGMWHVFDEPGEVQTIIDGLV